MRRFFATNTYPNIKDLLIFIFVFVLFNLVFGLLTHLIPVSVKENSDALFTTKDILLSFAYTASFVATIALCSIYRRVKSKNAPKIKAIFRRHNRVTFYYTLWALVMIVAAGVSVEPLTRFFPDSMSEMYDLMSSMGTLMVLVSVVVAPVVEEILFRGIIQSDLQRIYSPRFSIFVTSLIFGLVHLNPSQMVSAFVLSTVIGYVYHKTRSLWVVIFIHFFNNALAQTLFILYNDKESFLAPTHVLFGSPILYFCVFGVSLAITLVVIVQVARLGNVPEISKKTQQ